jgi:hypothetical protein
MRKALVPLIFIGAAMALLAGSVLAATGGPDDFGYTYIDSDEPGGPDFSYRDISSSGNRIIPDVPPATETDDDDSVVAGVPLGFSFTFYGTVYSSVNVSSNGNLQFAGTNDEYENDDLPTSEFGPAILPFWDDLDPSECGAVYADSQGSAPNRLFIVQWNACHNDSPTGAIACSVDVQAILLETSNEILFQYADTTFGASSCASGASHDADEGASATVGIQEDDDAEPDNYLQYSFDSDVLSSGLAICFQPPNINGDAPCLLPAVDDDDDDEEDDETAPTPTRTPTRTPTPTLTPTATFQPNISGGIAPLFDAAGTARDQRATATAGAGAQATPVPPAAPPAASQAPAVVRPPSTGDAGINR